MRFLVDTQLPKALVAWVQASGFNATHVLDLTLAQAKDNQIWSYATQNDLIIVSKDDDFAKWIQQGRKGPRVVWLRIGNASNPQLIFWISPRWPKVIASLEAGNRLVEVN